MNEKERRLADLCRKRGCEGAVLVRRANIAWLTDGADTHVDRGLPSGIATVIWTPRRRIVLTDVIEARRLRDEEFGDGWEVRERPWWERERRPSGRFLSDARTDPMAPLRASLTPAEVRRARTLGAETGDLVAAALRTLRRGATEWQAAAAVTSSLLRAGIFSRVLLAAADRRASLYRHPIPTTRKISRHLVLSVCAERRGLIVCLTRVIHFGPVPPDLRKRHEAVTAVDEALHAATRPGSSWRQILARGIDAYRDGGFAGEWKLHHQGGPMGYECRDFRVTLATRGAVAPSQMVGWNPSISGTKSEDTILAGGEILTASPGWPLLGTRPDILRIS